MTPLRRLEGIAYWVIEDPDGIYDFMNMEIRKEWEADARSEGRDLKDDTWLQGLPKRRWHLEIANVDRIKLNPDIMNYVDARRGYNFAESLSKRSEELRKAVEEYSTAIWPLIVAEENMELVDGYCRYSALKAVDARKIYAYLGRL
jgi:hypothetical protein